MRRLFIEDAHVGVGDGGFGCGPMEGPVVAEVKLRDDDGSIFFVSLAEFDGYPTFACTPESTIAWQLDPTDRDEETIEAYHNCVIAEGDEYEDIFERRDPEWFKVFRYLIYLVRARTCYANRFIDRTVGQYLNTIRIPVSDVEREWKEENREEEV